MMVRCGVLLDLLLCALCVGGAAVAGDEPNDRPDTGDRVFQEQEENGGFHNAQRVTSNCDVVAHVNNARDADMFAFEIEEATFVQAVVTPVEDIDFTLILFNEKRRIVTTLNGQGAGKPEDLLQRVRRGAYTLQVTVRTQAPIAEPRPYTLRLRRVTLMQYEPDIKQIKAVIKRGLAYLASQQAEDGHWPVKEAPHGISGLALMGYVGEGLPEFKDNVDRAVAYLKASHVPPGKSKDWPRQEAMTAGSLVGPHAPHFMYQHAIATLAMAEYVHHHKDPEARPMVEAAVNLILRGQRTSARPKILGGPLDNKDPHFGGWRYGPADRTSDLSASGWCLIALAAAETAGFKVPPTVKKDYTVFCRRCWSDKEKAFGYQTTAKNVTNTTNAVGALTTLLCVGGECDVIRQALKNLRYQMPHWEAEGIRRGYPFYYWYYGSRAMYVAGGDYWKQWQARVLPMLLDHQNDDGSWDVAEKEEPYTNCYGTAIAILILQICSGNPPAYLKGLELKTETYSCGQFVDDLEKLIKAAERDRGSKDDLIKQIQALFERYYGE